MRIHEGRGFILRTGHDSPLAGWLPLRVLDAAITVREAPWMAVQALGQIVRAFPGGLSLLWDAPPEWPEVLSPEDRRAFLGVLSQFPGLRLHFKDACVAEDLDGPFSGWFHAPEPPTGRMGQLWRQGWIGWVPDREAAWSLPGLGSASLDKEERGALSQGCLWGEVVMPVGALGEVGAELLAPLLADAQARLELDFSQRLGARAWPEAFPFQRRRSGWRVALLGGREFEGGSGAWEMAATRFQTLLEELRLALRCPIWAGTCHDLGLAAKLGHQAMHEGLPWRAALPMPPAPPVFSPGLAADPREPMALEARCGYPFPLAGILSHPPEALLRVPHVPQESAVLALLRGMPNLPAIRWMPPEVLPVGPFSAERPWPQAGAFPPLMDVTQALQPRLFEDE